MSKKYLCTCCQEVFSKEDMKFADDEFDENCCVNCYHFQYTAWSTFNKDLYYEIRKIKNGYESKKKINDNKTFREKLRLYITKLRTWLSI